MDKNAGPEPHSCIGRTGGKIAKFRMKGERTEPAQLGIYRCHRGIRFLQLASRRREATIDPLFQHPDAVPQLGRKLEVLALYRAAQLRLQVEETAAGIVGAALARALVTLTDVLARAVQPAEQVAQMRVERDIALIAAQPAGIAEVAQRAAARRAAQRVARRRHERARAAAFDHRPQKVPEGTLEHRAARFHALLLSALLAQMERDLGVVLHLGQVDDGVAFFAVISEHQGIASTELTDVSRPSSSKSTRSARPASWRLCVTTTTAVSYSRASRKKISCSRSAFA